MNEQQLESLLRQLPVAKAPEGMKASIMRNINPVADSAKPGFSAWPEKSLLIFSLIVACVSMVFFIDLSFVIDWFWLETARLSLLFSQNTLFINKAAGFAGKLPLYLLLTALTIGSLLLIERLLLKKSASGFNLLNL